MLFVVKNSWALLLGMMLLMLGNGLQGTLLGVRGAIEGMSPQVMSWVMTGYFVGFLFGSQMAPNMIRRVGHVRVFAALGSMVSACLILFAAWTDPFFWFFLRVVVGFCFSGVYVVAESWLNDSATNETRGQTLSAYLIVQMMGIVLAQGVLNFADPSGYTLFIIISVVVSLSFAPILLSVSPAPQFTTSKRMTFRELWHVSPLGVVGLFFLGAVFAALFGMASVFGTEKGLSVKDISLFVAMIYMGGMILQYPIGWVSDRMDRRMLIFIVCFVGMVFSLTANISDNFIWLLIVAFMVGGVSNPLYSLFIAYTNDYLEHDDMASASGGMIFVTGCGAIFGPAIVGWMLGVYGADSYFWFLGAMMTIMGGYALYRMTQTAAVAVEDTNAYAPVTPTSTPIAMEFAQEYAIEMALEEEAEAESEAENDTDNTQADR
jgi:MFS family permease